MISEKVRNAFNFEVNKFPLSGPDKMSTPFYGLFRSDSGECVGKAVSSKYVPHTTDDVVALAEAAEHCFDMSVDVRCHFDDGHYVNVIPSKDYRKSVYGTTDNIFPRLIISAGFDGTAFKATMGYYRDVCRNLAIMRSVKGTTESIRHMSQLPSHMEVLIEQFSRLKAGWNAFSSQMIEMEQRQIDIVDFLNEVYPQPKEAGRGMTIHKNRTEAIFHRVMRERALTGRPQLSKGNRLISHFEAFNAIQGYVQHESNRRDSSDFNKILLAASDPAVQRAEKLLIA